MVLDLKKLRREEKTFFFFSATGKRNREKIKATFYRCGRKPLYWKRNPDPRKENDEMSDFKSKKTKKIHPSLLVKYSFQKDVVPHGKNTRGFIGFITKTQLWVCT